MQEASEIVGAVRHQFAAAEADEQIEILALDRVRVGLARGLRQARHAQRRAAWHRRAIRQAS